MGPLKLGLDGVLTWIPAVGGLYSLGAGGFLVGQAVRARASRGTLAKMGLLLGIDALVGEVPIIGYLFDMVFRAHARAGAMLLRHIESTHYADEDESGARAAGRLEGHRAEMRSAGRKRLVFLRD